TDHVLDAVVSADRATWRWEDEDELAEALALGLLSADRAEFLRGEGLRAIERVQSSQPPYDRSWERWRPDPAWPVPSLPPGWDALEGGPATAIEAAIFDVGGVLIANDPDAIRRDVLATLVLEEAALAPAWAELLPLLGNGRVSEEE